jgi:hypothetical protein
MRPVSRSATDAVEPPRKKEQQNGRETTEIILESAAQELAPATSTPPFVYELDYPDAGKVPDDLQGAHRRQAADRRRVDHRAVSVRQRALAAHQAASRGWDAADRRAPARRRLGAATAPRAGTLHRSRRRRAARGLRASSLRDPGRLTLAAAIRACTARPTWSRTARDRRRGYPRWRSDRALCLDGQTHRERVGAAPG